MGDAPPCGGAGGGRPAAVLTPSLPAACLLRVSALSLVYLLALLLLPWLPGPSRHGLRGKGGGRARSSRPRGPRRAPGGGGLSLWFGGRG